MLDSCLGGCTIKTLRPEFFCTSVVNVLPFSLAAAVAVKMLKGVYR
jgi:hypothetical protein